MTSGKRPLDPLAVPEPGAGAAATGRRGTPDSPVLTATVGTALAYGVVGILALALAGPPGYASPLYPSAGIALAAVLVWGWIALPGVAAGAFAVNASLAAWNHANPLLQWAVPLAVAFGATLQAALGAWLVRRVVAWPLTLRAPGEILRAGLAGGLLACTLSATVATGALWALGALAAEQVPANWATWWLGDTMGVLIGAPLVLAFIGRPREDWAPRRRTVALPLAVALTLVGGYMMAMESLAERRVQAAFERDAARLASAMQSRLESEELALRAIHGTWALAPSADRDALARATRWWVDRSPAVQASGWVRRTTHLHGPVLPGEWALAQWQVLSHRALRGQAADAARPAGGAAEPAPREASAGIDPSSLDALRQAVRSGEPVLRNGPILASTGQGDAMSLLLSRYDEPALADAAARERSWTGTVVLEFSPARAFADLIQGPNAGWRWCLQPSGANPAAATAAGSATPGPTGSQSWTVGPLCTDLADATRSGRPSHRHPLRLADQELVLTLRQDQAPGAAEVEQARWLWSLSGLAAATLLGALLLTMTGQARRTELAVLHSTSHLRREMGEREQAESALRASEEQLRNILDHVPMGVVFLDPRGVILDVNPRLSDMLGRDAGVLRGQAVAPFFHADDRMRVMQLRRELLKGQLLDGSEKLRLLKPSGEALEVRVIASALRDAQGQVTHMVALIEDISVHLRLLESERALHRATEASNAKSEFVSRMSHELRTPLNAMIGFAQLLAMDPRAPLSEGQARHAQQIQRAGWHLLELINETLDLARIESGHCAVDIGPVALRPLLASCLELVEGPSAQRGLLLSLQTEGAVPMVLADATRLKQVLTNLLSNAIKYNRPQGAVTVRTHRQGQDHVEIAVADTGIGMTADQLSGLFQPYNRLGRESSDIEGTGMGLVIARKLTELMGGELRVSSEAGVGSCFTVRLPAVAADTVAADLATTTQPTLTGGGLRVHYVEDNPTNVEIMRGVLLQRPHVTLEVSTLGLDGLGAMRRQRPDLVLLDMHLPDISGLELLRHLKGDSGLADVPVIVVSADATPRQMEQALTLGALNYVTKPIQVSRFLEVLDAAFSGSDVAW